MHYLEFVQPIIDIVKSVSLPFRVTHMTQLSTHSFADISHIIICGTSLHDFGYQKHLAQFAFLKHYTKPVLGICAGMQIIAQVFDCTMSMGKEVGMKTATFENDFLGIPAGTSKEVYCLHNQIICEDEHFKKQFTLCAKTTYVQAIRHNHHPFYGILFHPEVRNKDIIAHFITR